MRGLARSAHLEHRLSSQLRSQQAAEACITLRNPLPASCRTSMLGKSGQSPSLLPLPPSPPAQRPATPTCSWPQTSWLPQLGGPSSLYAQSPLTTQFKPQWPTLLFCRSVAGCYVPPCSVPALAAVPESAVSGAERCLKAVLLQKCCQL